MQSNIAIKNFFSEQNIQIRKSIRQIDMYLAKETNKNQLKPQINILVVGPQFSGKKSLIRTMQFALNSNWEWVEQKTQLNDSIITKIQIKKGKRYKVQGLSKLQETDQKRTVSGFVVGDLSGKQMNQYSKALELMNNRIMGCMKQFSVQGESLFKDTNIRVCFICLRMNYKLNTQDEKCIKYFLSDLHEKNLKAIIILTHLGQNQKMEEKQKLQYYESKVMEVMRLFQIVDRNDVICMQIYHQFKNAKNSDIINYYALKLLQRVIKEGENYTKNQNKVKKSIKGWFQFMYNLIRFFYYYIL